jgi:hypothetical protein
VNGFVHENQGSSVSARISTPGRASPTQMLTGSRPASRTSTCAPR